MRQELVPFLQRKNISTQNLTLASSRASTGIQKSDAKTLTSQVALVVENQPASAGGIRDVGSFPKSERSPAGRHSNPPHYSCLENPMDRGARQATAHRVD